MANDEHVAILKKGVDAWNAWRRENYNISVDLRGQTSAGQASAKEFADLPTSLVGQLINHLAYPLFFVPATRSSPLPFLLF
jgi:hypothetical protein